MSLIWLRRNAGKLKQRRPMLIGTVAIALGATLLALLFIEPRYEAEAYLQIRGMNFAAQTNEVEVLRSRELARRLIEKHDLLSLAEFRPPLALADTPRLGKTAMPIPKSEGGFKSLAVSEQVITSDSVDIMYPALRYAVDHFLAHLKIDPVPNSLIVRLTYSATNAEAAASVVNNLAETYLDDDQPAHLRISLDHEQRVEMQSQLNSLRDWLKSPDTHEASPEMLSAPLIVELKRLEAVLTGRLADQAARYGNRHPFIKQTQTELQEVQAKIKTELVQIARTLEHDLAAASSRQKLATTEQAAQPVLNGSNARIISYAVAPEKPDYPNRTLFLVFGLLAGLGAGCLLSIFSTMLDTRISDSEELETVTGIPCYAAIAALPAHTDTTIAAYILRKPNSDIGEALRNLQLCLSLRAKSRVDGDVPKIVAVTSALENEGKTTIATALARLCAKAGERVILLDCDLREPSVHKALDLKNEHSLIDFLTGTTKLEDIIQKDEATGLHTITSRAVPNNAVDVLHSSKLEKLLLSLRKTYDLVLLDTPASHRLADARYIANSADFTLHVVEANHTTRKVVQQSLQALQDCNITTLATVLNKFNAPRQIDTYSDSDEQAA